MISKYNKSIIVLCLLVPLLIQFGNCSSKEAINLNDIIIGMLLSLVSFVNKYELNDLSFICFL